MPELPEVETVVNDLRPHVKGQVICDVDVRLEKMIQLSLLKFRQLAIGSKVVQIGRRAKMLLFKLDNGYTLIVHLKMSGQLIYQSSKDVNRGGGHPINHDIHDLPNKYTHITIKFRGGRNLFFNDVRQFGYMTIIANKSLEKFYTEKKLGPEPFDKSFTFEIFLKKLSSHKNSSVKQILLSQTAVVGLGNIYVDEVLFKAGIRPTRRIKSLSRKELKKIYLNIPIILKLAIKKSGTTMQYFRRGDGRTGDMLKFLKVYGRENKQCLRCKTSKIKRIRQGSRSSHYCPKCQQ
ncbi:bifunctional DNA-formamidopyrimidine glycosylase/DNA-(apurinic or apyrimidinic site) lyase [Patescibacteria group bacterium]|nr:bifunctional DNA-formamidopyrimidine glycosylase/DNA-(apurinic or apyrimidinic site) lyase [Patescibacteria group bacterium]MBU1890818.1 bifunctional DNA-formamidopyrimidine glycosylase/DNA-(apurinic or apyrimidinic site) lyase [Patescibacteria group bacterium]